MHEGLKQWLLVALAITLIVLGARGRFGSGLAALLTPQNMEESTAANDGGSTNPTLGFVPLP